MRLYSITNMYISPIQHGIQTQHSTVRLFVKYDKSRGDSFLQEDILYDWAYEHETTIVLNGGGHPELNSFLDLLKKWESNDVNGVLPYDSFCEPGVNNALTSISIIMPQDAIDFMSEIREKKPRQPIIGDYNPVYDDLKTRIRNTYSIEAVEILEIMAFLPLAK